MAKTRTYKRAKDGKFAIVAGSGSSKKSPRRPASKPGRKTATGGSARVAASRNRIVSRLAKGKRQNAVGSVAATRAVRNRLAIKKLKAAGVAVPAGTLKRISGLKKGQSVRLPGGATISRSATNVYTIKKPKKKSASRTALGSLRRKR